MTASHGPWIDVHAHPGRCFLAGAPAGDRLAELLGGDASAAALHVVTRGGPHRGQLRNRGRPGRAGSDPRWRPPRRPGLRTGRGLRRSPTAARRAAGPGRARAGSDRHDRGRPRARARSRRDGRAPHVRGRRLPRGPGRATRRGARPGRLLAHARALPGQRDRRHPDGGSRARRSHRLRPGRGARVQSARRGHRLRARDLRDDRRRAGRERGPGHGVAQPPRPPRALPSPAAVRRPRPCGGRRRWTDRRLARRA